VVDPLFILELSMIVKSSKKRLAFVDITTYAIMGHSYTSCFLRAGSSKSATRTIRDTALSYYQLSIADIAPAL
jgi:hypothetical protein